MAVLQALLHSLVIWICSVAWFLPGPLLLAHFISLRAYIRRFLDAPVTLVMWVLSNLHYRILLRILTNNISYENFSASHAAFLLSALQKRSLLLGYVTPLVFGSISLCNEAIEKSEKFSGTKKMYAHLLPENLEVHPEATAFFSIQLMPLNAFVNFHLRLNATS